METNPIVNILVTTDSNYIPYLNVMLFSLLRSTPEAFFSVYLLHSSLQESEMDDTRSVLGSRGRLQLVAVDDASLADAPTTARYPREIYYRIFAAQYLPPELDRILYLDPDIIVNRSVLPLYQTDMEDYFFAAASHVGTLFRKINGMRLDMDPEGAYINSGVMLMNLALLRNRQDPQEVYSFIKKYSYALFLPDQDIISSLYGTRIRTLDTFRYNMTERLYMQHVLFERTLDLDWIRENAVIIHYCGRNKPWKPGYRGQLDLFYRETLLQMAEASHSTKGAQP